MAQINSPTYHELLTQFQALDPKPRLLRTAQSLPLDDELFILNETVRLLGGALDLSTEAKVQYLQGLVE